MTPVSVYFITMNEEQRLAESIVRVTEWADEVIVVDSGSTDGTERVAREAGARFVYHPWQGFAHQKAFAASLCRNDWVLDLDADEVLSVELVKNIRQLFETGPAPDYAGFRMRWVLSPPVPGHPYRYERPQKLLRLYHRGRAAIMSEANSNNDRPRVSEGRVGFIPGDVLHRTLLNLSQLERKFCQLSDEQAAWYAAKERKISNLRLCTEFPLKFLKYYLLRGHCRNGWFGLATSVANANRNFMRLAKARELQLMQALETKKQAPAQRSDSNRS